MNVGYIDFIQYSLDKKKSLTYSFELIDWHAFMKFCHQQGILGIVYEGLERANKRITTEVLFEWISYVESIKQQNLIVNKRLLSIIKWFKNKGIQCITLKGQVNALMYPRPELRSPGDIDIWVDCEQIKIIKIIQKESPQSHYSIHHIKMPIFNDVSVEVHYRPIYLTNWIFDKRLRHHIEKIKETQFSHYVELDGNQICSLTDDFNVVYQLLHMFAHFFSTRNSFKQFIDYYYLLKEFRTDISNLSEIKSLISYFGIKKYAEGIMWVMKEVLGLSEQYLLVEPSEKVGKAIIKESMNYGTFSSNKLKYVAEMFSANIRLSMLFPSQVLISPLFLIWHQWCKIKISWYLKKNY